MRRPSIIVFVLGFVSTALLFAQTPGQQTTTNAGTGKATTQAGTPHKTTTVSPWVTTPSGLKYRDVIVGKGPQPKVGDTVVVNYTGKFTNGKVFDTSVGRQPFQFHLGRGEVIKGWDEGVGSMHVGGKRKLLIPPDLAYGKAGYPGVIPPNSTLTFDVELLKIK
jgi:FKBP-type peptidyl-prolyl cis-trans isomerase